MHSKNRLRKVQGAGSASFWKPVADCAGLDGVLMAWPGLVDEPSRTDIKGIDNLVGLAADQIKKPVYIVAHPLGALGETRASPQLGVAFLVSVAVLTLDRNNAFPPAPVALSCYS